MYFFTAKFTKTQCEKENYGTTITKVIGDWQIGCKDIKTRMVNLYYSDSYTDCTFLVGTGQLVSAHKVVLAAASPVFAAMFYGGMPENGGPIHIDDIEPDTFIEMLRYIYTDNTDMISFNDACALYYAAKKYMLLHLKTECLEYLIKNLTAKDCCLAYEFAQMFDENNLLNACEELMKTKTNEVLTSAGFLDASLRTVHFIYSMNKLAISELELFEALERYAKVNDKPEELGQNNICVNNRNTESPKEVNGMEDKNNKNIENGHVSTVKDYEKTQNGICPVYVNDMEDKNNENIENGHVTVDVKEYEKTQNRTLKDCGDNDIEDNKIKNENECLKEDEETKIKTAEDSKTGPVTIRHCLKLVRFLAMSAEEFISSPVASFLLTQTETLTILINIINQAESKVPMPEGFSTVQETRCSKEVALDPETRNMIKFRFTVPECEYLQNGDVIHFPQYHALNFSWKVILKLEDNECEAAVLGTGSEECNFILKLCVKTKRGVKRYEFDSDGFESTEYIGTLGNWNDLLNKCMEGGSLCFDVEIQPQLDEDLH